MYDVRAIAGRVVLNGGFETQPLTVCSSALRTNRNFVPPERFLPGLRLRH
jgi:hypothetical protein